MRSNTRVYELESSKGLPHGRPLIIFALLFVIVALLTISTSFSSSKKAKIGPDGGLLSFEVDGMWETETSKRGKVIEFIAANRSSKLALIYYEDRALPYNPTIALDRFLKKYKFKYLPGESLITKTVQGKEMKVHIYFALGSGMFRGERHILFARSSLIDNTNIVLIALTPPDKFKGNFPQMKRLLGYRWKDR